MPSSKASRTIRCTSTWEQNFNGWMPSLLSSVDPIFFAHHCNIDRLWDVWTTKERNAGRTALPGAADAPRFDPEPFLFYTDADRNVVPTVAQDQMETTPWDYSYTPGMGAEDPDELIALGGLAPVLNAETESVFSLDEGGSARLGGIEDFAEAAATPAARQTHLGFVPSTRAVERYQHGCLYLSRQ